MQTNIYIEHEAIRGKRKQEKWKRNSSESGREREARKNNVAHKTKRNVRRDFNVKGFGVHLRKWFFIAKETDAGC